MKHSEWFVHQIYLSSCSLMKVQSYLINLTPRYIPFGNHGFANLTNIQRDGDYPGSLRDQSFFTTIISLLKTTSPVRLIPLSRM
jgi:hypothetical protein